MVDVEVLAVMGELLVVERSEEEVDGLLVAGARARPAARLPWADPAVTGGPDAPLVAAAGEDVRGVDHAREHRRVVVRQRVQHRAEADVRVRAAAAQSAVGLAEIENFGKKKCSIAA